MASKYLGSKICNSEREQLLRNRHYQDWSFGLTKKQLSTEIDNGVNSYPYLHDIAIEEILKHIHDQQKILTCRLVCMQWHDVIENNSELMKKITFTIDDDNDLEGFLSLEIVKRKKVKSIKFLYPLQLDSDENRNHLINFISKVEKVDFAIADKQYSSNRLLLLVLQRCTNLQELIVSSHMFPGRSEVDHMFFGINGIINIAASNIIQIISINVSSLMEEGANHLGNLILSLPKLKEIELTGFIENCTAPARLIIFKALLQYFNNYWTQLQLKRLSLYLDGTIPIYEDGEHCELLILLLFYRDYHSVAFNGLPSINIRSLLQLGDLPYPFLQRRPLFKAIVNAELTFREDEQPLPSSDMLFSLNIQNLDLTFERGRLSIENLNWINDIHGLKSLWMGISNQQHQQVELQPSSIVVLYNIFSAGIPSLEELGLVDFWPLNNFLWSQSFPNLNELMIDSYEEIPSDLISQLTVLASLTVLSLRSLDNLLDNTFTTECENMFAMTNGGHSFATAIACFNKLKLLELYDCNNLTWICLRIGIAKCNNLEKLEISHCYKLQRVHCKLVKHCEVEYSSAYEQNRTLAPIWIQHNNFKDIIEVIFIVIVIILLGTILQIYLEGISRRVIRSVFFGK